MNSSDHSSECAKMRTEALWVWYAAFPALRGVTVSFPRQSVTSLIGPSGCGKTTLLRSLNRTLENQPDTRWMGHVYLDGDDIHHPQIEVMELRRRVALVTQEAVPFPLSIFDNIAYGPRLCGIRNREKIAGMVEEALRRAAIWDEVQERLDSPAHHLSGGQQRRLCIARSLATNPEVLLLDEPGAMLDPTATSRIEDLICELKQHYAVIVITHNVHQAARISDYTAFFIAGELIEFGRTAKIFTRPDDERTDSYLSGRLKGQ